MTDRLKAELPLKITREKARGVAAGFGGSDDDHKPKSLLIVPQKQGLII